MNLASKVCPQCGLGNPPSAERCNCGYEFHGVVRAQSGEDDVRPPAELTIGPSTARPLKHACVVTLVWGGFELLWGAVGPLEGKGLELSAGIGFLGLLLISLGLAVKRGNAFAAWCLAAIAAAVLVLSLWQRTTSGLLWPILVCITAVRAGLYLRKQRWPEAEAQTWVRMLYELAFLQAGWTAVAVAWTLAVEPATLRAFLGYRFSILNILDVGLLAGFGFAAWKRQPWAGYALLLYQLGNVHLHIMRPAPTTDMFIPLGFALVYGTGGLHLHRLHGPMTRGGKVAVALVAAFVVATSVDREVRRLPFYQRLAEEFGIRLLAIPGYRERLSASKADPARVAAEIAMQGTRRLTDAQLVERARLLGSILTVLDEHNCAEGLRGGRGTVEPALPKIPQDELHAWLELSYSASLAEIQNMVPAIPNPPDEAIAEAMLSVRDALSEDEAARFEKIALESGESFEQTEDFDACWFFRTMVNSVPRLDALHQRTIARLLVAQ